MRKFITVIFYILALWPLVLEQVVAQDPLFTQFYSTPVYLNPAFSGTTDHYRVATVYRREWAQVPRALETNLLSFEYNLEKLNSGVGLLVMNDRSGNLGVQANYVALSYAYQVGLSDTWQLRFGLSGGVIGKNANFNRYTFGDAIDSGGGTLESLGGRQGVVPDLSAGALAFSEKWWLGFAYHHLNQPSSTQPDLNYRVPGRVSLHTGARLSVGAAYPNKFLSPALLFQSQGGNSQLDLGLNVQYASFVFGAWYRGLPVLKGADLLPAQDALAFLTGFQFDAWWIGYSYDLALGGRAGVSGGSHEISIVLEPFTQRSRSKILCPAFYKTR